MTDGLGKRTTNADGSYFIEYPSGGKITFDATGKETGREVGLILHKWDTKGRCEVCKTDVAGSLCSGFSETEKTLTTSLEDFDEWKKQSCEMMECQHARLEHNQNEFECTIPDCVCEYFYRKDEEGALNEKIDEAIALEDEIMELERQTETDPNNITLVTKLYDKKNELAKLEGDNSLPDLPKNLSGFAALDYMANKLAAQESDKKWASSDNKPIDTSGVQKSFTGTGGYSYGGTKKFCVHRPQQVITGDGWSVWAGAKWDCKGSARRFPVVMNLMGTSITPQHSIPIPELKQWESKASIKEIMIDWPDMDVVEFPVEFWTDIRDYIQKEKKKMLIFCIGGHGRTGTAVACLLVVSCKMTATEAINWVRKNYCGEAIENKWQEDYVHEIYQQFRDLRKPKKKGKNAKSEKA